MILKFLDQGGTEPALALRYCSPVLDPTLGGRDAVILLRGSPDQFERIASSLRFQERYKSCVMSWAAGDVPTAEQLGELFKDFEEVSFAGLSPERFCWCAFLHQKGTRTDVHVLIATVDLLTGKHFNPAPPGWKHSYDPVRDLHNSRHGWSSPADPRLARAVQLGSRPAWVAARVREALAVEPNTKQVLCEVVTDLVARKQVRTRADILEALGEYGEITRAGDDYISIKPPGFTKAVRLRGTLFHSGFDASTFKLPSPKPKPDRTDADREAEKNPVEEAAARVRLDVAIQRRSAVNQERYRPKRRAVSTAQVFAIPERTLARTKPAMDLRTSPDDAVVADIPFSGETTIGGALEKPPCEETRLSPIVAPTPIPTSIPTLKKTSDAHATGTAIQELFGAFTGRIRARLEELAQAFDSIKSRLGRRVRARAAADAVARGSGTDAGAGSGLRPPGRRAP